MLPRAALLLLGSFLATLHGSELSRRLDQAVQSIPEGGQAGLAVYDVTANRWLYLAGSTDLLSLASTTKLLTTVAAYHFLGGSYQFATRGVALGPIVAGALPGLGIIGGCDPCLDSHFYNDEPEQPFRQWAAHLKQLGVTRITGDIVIDTRLCSGPIRPATYPQDAENLERWYSAPACAFPWNDNCIEVRAEPTVIGHPAEVQVRPHTPLVEVHNLVRTVAGKGSTAITRDAATNSITVSGTCGQGPGGWFPVAEATDPDLLAGGELASVLAQEGIPVSGSVRLGTVDATGKDLLIDQRHDLQPALELMNQHSQNFYAEELLRLVGYARFHQGSIDAGRAAVAEALVALLGKDGQDVQLLDGSGLSYGNRASAALMVKMLVAIGRTPVGPGFLATLKERQAGPVRGYVKTGTHAQACCLVGYLDLPSHHRIAFASLLNRGQARTFDWSGRLREGIFKILAESADR